MGRVLIIMYLQDQIIR